MQNLVVGAFYSVYELEATEGYVILRSGVGIFVSWQTIILKQRKVDCVKITKSHNILSIAFYNLKYGTMVSFLEINWRPIWCFLYSLSQTNETAEETFDTNYRTHLSVAKTERVENAVQTGGIWKQQLCILVWTENFFTITAHIPARSLANFYRQ